MATKKVKKVETPIDERETFVSIRKSFADSDVSVEEKLKTLYQLQLADTEIDKILFLRGELPVEVEALERDINQLNAKITAETGMIDGYNKTIAMAKEKIVDCDTQIAQYKKQLENIANSREFDSINKEIENQELERQIAEKNIGEAKVKIAESKAEIEDIKAAIEVRQEDLEAKKQELSTSVESTSKEEAALRAKREACAEKIDARVMSAYERIRASVANHLAVVSVFDEDSCGGCFNTIIPQRLIDIASRKKLVICEHCGRIIVSPDIME